MFYRGDLAMADDNHPRDEGSAPATAHPRRSRFSGVDGVTAEDRARPFGESAARFAAEEKSRRAIPDQLPLFAHLPEAPGDATIPTDLAELRQSSSLTLARSWYKHDLERQRRPRNTIDSYSYDLMVLENLIGPKPLNRISNSDIARYLGEASSKTTRKRRLTSARRFFHYLINEVKVLKFDPTDGFYPHRIPQGTPRPLFESEQEAMLAAARADEAWSGVAVWLMMRLGLTRSELLALQRDHIDRTDPERPIVHIYYDDVAKQSKERKLAADSEFSTMYDAFLEARDPSGVLFPVGRQAVNGMVERVRRAAGIQKDVTPTTLRHTFAIAQARKGANEDQLLALLGLADDPRNRATVRGYIAHAAPPLNADITNPDGTKEDENASSEE
jgi:integrase/recombinase XerD